MDGKSVKKIDILGFLMVILPLVSSILLWYWFYNIEIIASMILYQKIMLFGTIFLTAILATIDAHRLGMKVVISKEKNLYGGRFLLFFLFILLWIYTYPVFLLKRKQAGSRNLFFPLVISLLIYIGSTLYIWYAVEIKYTEDIFQKRLMHMRRR